MAGPIWFDHAPFSPWIRRGNYWRDGFADVGREIENTIGEVTYCLAGAAACNGIAVPELVTGQVEVKPVAVRTRTGSGRLMY